MARRRARAPDASEASSSGGGRGRGDARVAARGGGRGGGRGGAVGRLAPFRRGRGRGRRVRSAGPRRGGRGGRARAGPAAKRVVAGDAIGGALGGLLEEEGRDRLRRGLLPRAPARGPPGREPLHPAGTARPRGGARGECRRDPARRRSVAAFKKTSRDGASADCDATTSELFVRPRRPDGQCHVARGICERCRPPRERHNKYLPRKSSTALAACTPSPRPPRTMAASAATPRESWCAPRAPRAGGWRRVGAPTAPGRAGAPRVVAPPPGIIASLARRRAGSVVLGVDISASPRAAASRRLARRVRRRARAGPRPRRARRRATRETRRPPTVTTTTATTTATRRPRRSRTPRGRSRRRDDSRTSSRTKPPRAFARPSPPRAWSSPWTRTTTAPAELRRPRVPPRGI